MRASTTVLSRNALSNFDEKIKNKEDEEAVELLS